MVIVITMGRVKQTSPAAGRFFQPRFTAIKPQQTSPLDH